MIPARVDGICAPDRIARVLLPYGGHVLMLVETYFDESGTHEGAAALCVAGYIIERGQSERMADEWRAVLAKYNLPYFHMVDAAPGNGVFAGIPVKERALIVANMIGIIKRRTVQGLAVALDMKSFEARFGAASFFGNPYTLCVHQMMTGVAAWAEATSYNGKIAYFFEAGHASQTEANNILTIASKDSKISAEMHYGGHAFVPKEMAPQLQAADLLAWQWAKDIKSKIEGRARRKDFANLSEHPHAATYMDGKVFDALKDLWESHRKSLGDVFGENVNFHGMINAVRHLGSKRF